MATNYQKEVEETTRNTKAALEKMLNVKLSAAQPKKVPAQSLNSKFIKYKPCCLQQQLSSSGRIVKIVNMPMDPLGLPKFKHKKLPKPSGSPPVPLMHSPPRPATVKDRKDWKIPPCISNWKNPRGYTIPLDKRLASGGSRLQDVDQINDNLAKLQEALCIAELKAREAVTMRAKIQREIMLKEKEKKETELLECAQKARCEIRAHKQNVKEEGTLREEEEEKKVEIMMDRLQREEIREDRRRERKRKQRLEATGGAAMAKRNRITRDRDRDISEKVALGMATTTGISRNEVVTYDQRLFNQDEGIDSGFASDDLYNIYDKGLFTSQTTHSTLFRPNKDVDSEMHGGADEQREKIIMNTEHFKPHKSLSGALFRSRPKDMPVEFEKEAVEDDLFGLDKFITEINKSEKQCTVRSSGTINSGCL